MRKRIVFLVIFILISFATLSFFTTDLLCDDCEFCYHDSIQTDPSTNNQMCCDSSSRCITLDECVQASFQPTEMCYVLRIIGIVIYSVFGFIIFAIIAFFIFYCCRECYLERRANEAIYRFRQSVRESFHAENLPQLEEDFDIDEFMRNLNQQEEKILNNNQKEEENQEKAGGDSTCSICLVDYAIYDRKTQRSCRHVFHQLCIYRWEQQSLLCPLCRAPK